MARPSQHVDLALLESGRALYPRYGCAGLSVRGLAEHAGVNPGMFHYHFKTKEKFLRTLLGGLYEEMFSDLRVEAAHQGPAIDRLQGFVGSLARFLRDHRQLIVRVWMDALAGEPIAQEFLRSNMPRHLALLTELLAQAEREQAIAPRAEMQRAAFVLGSVAMPMVLVASLIDAGVAPQALRLPFTRQVMSDAAIAERVALALQALRMPIEESTA
jgi:AcrR family transcriptional regulator